MQFSIESECGKNGYGRIFISSKDHVSSYIGLRKQ